MSKPTQAVGAPLERHVRPLRRGVDGVCTRNTCECEREGLQFFCEQTNLTLEDPIEDPFKFELK